MSSTYFLVPAIFALVYFERENSDNDDDQWQSGGKKRIQEREKRRRAKENRGRRKNAQIFASSPSSDVFLSAGVRVNLGLVETSRDRR